LPRVLSVRPGICGGKTTLEVSVQVFCGFVDLLVKPFHIHHVSNSAASCPSRKLISHSIKPPTVRNDDAGHRLLEIGLAFQVLAVAPIAIQDYPFPLTGAWISLDTGGLPGLSRWLNLLQ
jgi:hypothetical protein